MYVIVAGEMTDVDYCSVYGPYHTKVDAETAAQQKIASGEIVEEPEDCMEYRVMELK